MLLFVPLLAAFWPLVQLVVGESKKELLVIAQSLETSAAQLKNSAPQLDEDRNTGIASTPPQSSKTDNSIGTTANHAKNVSEHLRRAATMLPSFLPSVWVYGFFAALAVTLGHFVYQTSAPKTIQKYSLEEFQEEQVAAFVRNPASDIITHADNRIKTAASNAGTFLNGKLLQCLRAVRPLIDEFKEKVAETHNRDETVKDPAIQKSVLEAQRRLIRAGEFYALEMIQWLTDQPSNPFIQVLFSEILGLRLGKDVACDDAIYILDYVLIPFRSEDPQNKTQHEREKIWIAARIDYIDGSGYRPVLSAIAFAFYIIAMGLIIWLSWGQIVSVLTAAGWIGAHPAVLGG